MLCLKAEVMDGCQQRVYGIDLFGELAESDECCVCAMFVLSHSVMLFRVLSCSIVYCLCLPLSLLGRRVGRYGDRGYYVHYIVEMSTG